MEELSQFLVLASEEFEEDGQDNGGLDDVLSTHDSQASHECHADLLVQNRVVLLQKVEHLGREERG